MRSNGTVTYVGKDIAYQLWKFGLLGKDFFYRKLHRLSRRPSAVCIYRHTERSSRNRAAFGNGDRVYNVIDSRQSYLQDVVVAGLKALGFDEAGRELDPFFI